MPTDMSKYPKNWKSEIRPAILKRAGNKCEWCGVHNHALGVRIKGEFLDCTNDPMQLESFELVDELKVIRIVLTIAHVHNPDPMDCRPENLAALCQKCHNTHDAPMRAKKAAETRARKRNQKQKEQGQMMIKEVYGYPRGGGRTSLYYKAFMVANWSEYDKSDYWLREEEMRIADDEQ